MPRSSLSKLKFFASTEEETDARDLSWAMRRTHGAELYGAPRLEDDEMLKTFGVAVGLVLASASAGAQDAVIDLPAGSACAGFDLRVEIWATPNRVSRQFTDKNGNIVRTFTGGKGNSLAFTNLLTGATLALRPNGSVEQVALLPDGSQQWVVTGHNVLILFPTDVPAGPSTTIYVGRVSFSVDPSGIFTLGRTSGKASDLCAMLSS